MKSTVYFAQGFAVKLIGESGRTLFQSRLHLCSGSTVESEINKEISLRGEISTCRKGSQNIFGFFTEFFHQ